MYVLRKDKKMKILNRIAIAYAISLLLPAAWATGAETAVDSRIVAVLYPNLTSGVLTFARLTQLPQGILMRADNVEIEIADVNSFIAKQPGQLQEQLRKNAFFVLEQQATRKLLLQLGKKTLQRAAEQLDGKDELQIIQAYLEKVIQEINVTDAEIEAFYEANKDMFGGATLEQVKDPIREYVRQQRQNNAIAEHIRTLGKKITIELSATWVKKQAVLAKDNPVDRARDSGKPSLVDFGSTGCVPCDMMAPILDRLKEKYEGKLNVLFVHVVKEQILAARYGIQSIPVQIFFDKTGKEVFRHVGFFPQEEIEKRLSDMGVK